MFLRRLDVNLLFFAIVSIYAENSPYALPDVTFEAFKNGGFKAYIPDVPGITQFDLHVNINKEISPLSLGEIFAEIRTPTNGYWILEFKNTLKIGDHLNYWVSINVKKDSARWNVEGTGLSVEITELLDEYSQMKGKCEKGSTVINDGKPTCIGDVIIHDEFKGSSINTSIWTVEHRIPTYTGPNYEFNSYEDRYETHFLYKEKLLLKPIALTRDSDVRGVLDLRSKCTSNQTRECYYQQRSVFVLPPVKSAKITSKTSFKYGKIEIRARLPAGDWIVPVMQLEAKVSDSNEHLPRILIAYSRDNNYLITSIASTDNNTRNVQNRCDIGSRILFGGPIVYSIEPERSKNLIDKYSNVPYNNKFHIYGLEWTEDKLTFTLDSTIYGMVDLNQNFSIPHLGVGNNWKTKRAPFNEEFILSLGVAVGGLYDFPDEYYSENNLKPWKSESRTYIKDFFEARSTWLNTWIGDKIALEIDYVKVTAI